MPAVSLPEKLPDIRPLWQGIKDIFMWVSNGTHIPPEWLFVISCLLAAAAFFAIRWRRSGK